MNISLTQVHKGLQLLEQLVMHRTKDHFTKEASTNNAAAHTLQQFQPLAEEAGLSVVEFVILMIGLVPHIQPSLIDSIIQQYLPQGGEFAEIGGVRGNHHRGMLPTGETAQFIIGGNDFSKRLEVQNMLQPGSKLLKHDLLYLEAVRAGEPVMSGRLLLQEELLHNLFYKKKYVPRFSQDFPASILTTAMEWKDVVLHPRTLQQVHDIKVWLQHNQTLMNDWQMHKRLKRGYRVLFYGPPGTGKTLTASLLGKEFSRDVYRIDLSQVVSKYIGETEKNLEKIFARAENKDWILFFDEADALFGKRTNVRDAHDKYANQEVSYLLQRVEDFPGLIILASNFKSNIDSGFVRRFNSIIHFPMPNAEERYKLWQQAIPPKAILEKDVDLQDLANRYELTGSAIVQVIHYASLVALQNHSRVLTQAAILEGIKREYEKDERVFG